MNKSIKTNRILVILTFTLLLSILASACSATVPGLLEMDDTATPGILATVEPVIEGSNIPLVAALQPTEPAPIAITGQELSLVDLYARANPAVVNITIYNIEGNVLLPVGQGSGFLFDEDGHIVTNAHVVQEAQSVEVTFSDGTIRDAEVVASSALALTDHGNLHGAWDFQETAHAKGIKPIIGFEAYVAYGDRRQRERPRDAPADSAHLVLLARDLTGYRNLVRLTSRGFMEGFYRKPRIDHEILSEHSEGIIVLSACLSGEVAKNLQFGRYDRAKAAAEFYARTFPDRYYLEVQDHGIEAQRRILNDLDDITADMSSRNAEVTGQTRIGVIGTTARWLIPRMAAASFLTPPVTPMASILARPSGLPRATPCC